LPFRLNSHNSDIVNSNEISINDLIKAPPPNNFYKWDIPNVNIETIHKISKFNFQTALSIKTHEEIVSLQNGLQTISLIKLAAIQIHLIDKNKGHCLNKLFIFQVKTKLPVGTIDYSPSTFHYSSTISSNHCS